MFHGGQHDDRQRELGCREHLDEEAPSDRCSATEPAVDGHRTREESRYNPRGGNGTNYLCYDNHASPCSRHGANQEECEGDLIIDPCQEICSCSMVGQILTAGLNIPPLTR